MPTRPSNACIHSFWFTSVKKFLQWCFKCDENFEFFQYVSVVFVFILYKESPTLEIWQCSIWRPVLKEIMWSLENTCSICIAEFAVCAITQSNWSQQSCSKVWILFHCNTLLLPFLWRKWDRLLPVERRYALLWCLRNITFLHGRYGNFHYSIFCCFG